MHNDYDEASYPYDLWRTTTDSTRLSHASDCEYFFVDVLSVPAWIAHPDGRVKYCNDVWVDTCGLNPENTYSDGWMDAIHPEDIETVLSRWEHALSEESVLQCELRLKTTDESHFHRHLCRVAPHLNKEGEIDFWFGSFTPVGVEDDAVDAYDGESEDIGHFFARRDEDLSAEDRYRLVSENAPGMIYQFALHTNGTMSFPFVSQGSCALFGIPPRDIEKDVHLLISLISPEDLESFQASVALSAQTMTRWTWAGWADIANGQRKWITCSSTPKKMPNGDIIWDGLLMDSTENKMAQIKIEMQRLQLQEANLRLGEANQKLELLASHDPLTGLRNRRSFQERLLEEFQWRSRFGSTISLLLLDVDKFKTFNDTFGHPAGDEVLKTVARLLRESVREIDLAARYGGEEFVVILSKAEAEPAIALAERIRRTIEGHPWVERAITASIGVATLTAEMQMTPEELVKSADEALYASKENGRNRVTHASVLMGMEKSMILSRVK